MLRSFLLPVVAAAATLAAVLTPVAASAHSRPKATVSAVTLLAGLRVAAPDSAHRYVPDRFGGDQPALDADGDGCTTREEVLIRDRVGAVRGATGCAVAGRWRSRFDGTATTHPSTLEIDHLVPLAEAWHAGAWRWTHAHRLAFANDLGYRWALQPVSAALHRAKGERDPARWVPGANRCTYVKAWIGVKSRWRLAVDPAEQAALGRALSGCADVRMLRPGKPDIRVLTGRTAAAALRRVSRLDRPRVYFFGDSWTHGASADPGRGFPAVVGETLGWQVELGPDNSGAGYVHTWNPAHPVFPVGAAALGPIEADLIVLEGGLNDEPGPLTFFEPAVQSTVAALRAKAGGAPVVMVGPASPDGTVPEGLAAIDGQEAVMARRLGVRYISPVQERWFNPDNVTALMDPQTLHPNTAGHAYYGARLAADLQRILAG